MTRHEIKRRELVTAIIEDQFTTFASAQIKTDNTISWQFTAEGIPCQISLNKDLVFSGKVLPLLVALTSEMTRFSETLSTMMKS